MATTTKKKPAPSKPLMSFVMIPGAGDHYTNEPCVTEDGKTYMKRILHRAKDNEIIKSVEDLADKFPFKFKRTYKEERDSIVTGKKIELAEKRQQLMEQLKALDIQNKALGEVTPTPADEEDVTENIPAPEEPPAPKAEGVSPSDESPEPLQPAWEDMREVTDQFIGARLLDLKVFKLGNHYFVTKDNEPYKMLTERPLSKAGVVGLMKEQGQPVQ